MNQPVQQLNAIQAMLNAGQRNLRMERHTLLLWVIPAGVLFALCEHILTPAQLPDLNQRALAWLVLIGVTMLTIAIIDWRWTQEIKAVRDETWSFIHRQVLKVLWLLMGLATLSTFAMFFYGGGYMTCAVWLIFAGIGLYVHGLFSEELLEWTGGLMVLVGIVTLVSGLPFETMRWIAASVFGLGLPAVALMLDRGRHRPARFRLGQMLLWLLAFVILPFVIEQSVNTSKLPEGPTLSLADVQAGLAAQGEHIVALPAGTPIPVMLELGGDIFVGQDSQAILPLTLQQPVEVLMRDGQLSGYARLAGESWQSYRRSRWISIPWLKAELTQGTGPRVTGSLIVQFRPR